MSPKLEKIVTVLIILAVAAVSILLARWLIPWSEYGPGKPRKFGFLEKLTTGYILVNYASLMLHILFYILADGHGLLYYLSYQQTNAISDIMDFVEDAFLVGWLVFPLAGTVLSLANLLRDRKSHRAGIGKASLILSLLLSFYIIGVALLMMVFASH
jgi:hypothetical protein